MYRNVAWLFRIRVVTAACALLIAAPALAANLLANPDFDTDDAGWSVGTASWTGADGHPTPGSVVFPFNSSISQCVPIAAQPVDLFAYAKTSLTAPEQVYFGLVHLSTFPTADCSGPQDAAVIQAKVTQIPATPSGWALHRLANAALPAATQSVLVVLNAPFGAINFDHVAFGPAGTIGLPPLPTSPLVNGDFDYAQFPWTTSGGARVVNFDGHPTPSTAFLPIVVAGGSATFYQCVDIAAQRIDLVAYAKQTGFAETNLGLVSLAPYLGPDCTNPLPPTALKSARITLQSDGWSEHRLTDYQLPAGTRSVIVFLQAIDTGAGTTSVYFDHVLFGPTGAVGAPPANPNLLTNPEFTKSVFGWTASASIPFDQGATWTNDAGNPAAGSAVLAVGGPGFTAFLEECIPISLSRIAVTGRFNIVDGASPGQITVHAYNQTNCDGPQTVFTATPVPGGGGWYTHTLFDQLVPAGTNSLKVRLSLQSTDGNDAQIRMDHIEFGAAGTIGDRILKNGFE